MFVGIPVADEVAGHSPADQLPIEKNTRGTSVQSMYDAEKVSARHF